MKLQYSVDTDILMLLRKDALSINAIAEPGGVIVVNGEPYLTSHAQAE
jgi:hypothetical protein